MSRRWYEVRIRKWLSRDRSVKKSKFYFARSSADAANKYHGPGSIMSVSKVGAEQALGIGDFFRLGDELLRELRKESKNVIVFEGISGKNTKRGYYGQERQKTTNQYK